MEVRIDESIRRISVVLQSCMTVPVPSPSIRFGCMHGRSCHPSYLSISTYTPGPRGVVVWFPTPSRARFHAVSPGRRTGKHSILNSGEEVASKRVCMLAHHHRLTLYLGIESPIPQPRGHESSYASSITSMHEVMEDPCSFMDKQTGPAETVHRMGKGERANLIVRKWEGRVPQDRREERCRKPIEERISSRTKARWHVPYDATHRCLPDPSNRS